MTCLPSLSALAYSGVKWECSIMFEKSFEVTVLKNEENPWPPMGKTGPET